MNDSSLPLALLIDGDNATPKIVTGLLARQLRDGERQAHLWRLDETELEWVEGMPA
ncbi:hypothetical protein GGD56_006509 [Rhizobium mongolense]|uniref:NYN domain-containing protein n=1 Tax=Rhizobium mongolense TaxID=57676 RepID=A0ABR6IXG4_9HYPH|nr:hypothetical protein [Rhizobium mongolense]